MLSYHLTQTESTTAFSYTTAHARYSSDRQTEQSIEGQLKECYEYARRNGYTVVGEYIDRAISGTTDHRPEFLRMIADGDKKLFQAVLVYQLDRFARNRYDSATYKAKLKKNGIRVLSARENISDDASGVLMEAVLEGMAEYYSVELSQKIRRGMDINAEKCLSTGGNLALGFRVDSEKHIQIDPDTVPVVQKIFEMYASGQSMADIIRYLNANHIKTSYGNEFNKNSLNRILRNKRYIGVYTYRGTETPDGLPRMQQLEKDLNEEANRKYDFIIERTNAIAGEITDASGLSIGSKQDLNGFIVGTRGTAKVQTIGAGGYNIQCFHFRTLINAV